MKAPPKLRSRISSICATALVSAFLGCQSQENAVLDDELTWKQAEAALASPSVRNIRDLYRQIADTPVENARPSYANLDEREAEFVSFSEYLQSYYPEGAYPGITPEMAREMVSQNMTAWKSDTVGVNDIERVYSLHTRHATKAERLAHWDSIIYFDIFTNTDGDIVGWRIVR
jgi:hypothetical protein